MCSIRSCAYGRRRLRGMATGGSAAAASGVEEPAGWKANRSHCLYKKLSAVSTEVNLTSLPNVKIQLEQLGLAITGVEAILRKRLKNHLKLKLIASDATAPSELASSTDLNPYRLEYLCVLDFEATCEEKNPPDYIHEVIEFPVLLFNLKTLKVDAEFHSYCKPCLNPLLSDFCKRLTGIKQEEVDKAPSFLEVFRNFISWLDEKEILNTHKFAIVTDCPWDIKSCLFPQCVLMKVTFPQFAYKWIDVRKLFSSFYRVPSGNLAKMLESLGLEFEGRQHCGLDDARNICRIVAQLVRDGCILKYNCFISPDIVAQYSHKS